MTLQHIEAQKAARYVGNYSEKQAQRRALDEMLKGYKGKITELPGPNFKPRPVHHHCEDPNEFCGLIKLSRVKNWFNAGTKNLSRRKMILKFVDMTEDQVLYITLPANEQSLSNREYRNIMNAMPLVEAEEQRLLSDMTRPLLDRQPAVHQSAFDFGDVS